MCAHPVVAALTNNFFKPKRASAAFAWTAFFVTLLLGFSPARADSKVTSIEVTVPLNWEVVPESRGTVYLLKGSKTRQAVTINEFAAEGRYSSYEFLQSQRHHIEQGRSHLFSFFGLANYKITTIAKATDENNRSFQLFISKYLTIDGRETVMYERQYPAGGKVYRITYTEDSGTFKEQKRAEKILAQFKAVVPKPSEREPANESEATSAVRTEAPSGKPGAQGLGDNIMMKLLSAPPNPAFCAEGVPDELSYKNNPDLDGASASLKGLGECGKKFLGGMIDFTLAAGHYAVSSLCYMASHTFTSYCDYASKINGQVTGSISNFYHEWKNDKTGHFWANTYAKTSNALGQMVPKFWCMRFDIQVEMLCSGVINAVLLTKLAIGGVKALTPSENGLIRRSVDKALESKFAQAAKNRAKSIATGVGERAKPIAEAVGPRLEPVSKVAKDLTKKLEDGINGISQRRADLQRAKAAADAGETAAATEGAAEAAAGDASAVATGKEVAAKPRPRAFRLGKNGEAPKGAEIEPSVKGAATEGLPAKIELADGAKPLIGPPREIEKLLARLDGLPSKNIEVANDIRRSLNNIANRGGYSAEQVKELQSLLRQYTYKNGNLLERDLARELAKFERLPPSTTVAAKSAEAAPKVFDKPVTPAEQELAKHLDVNRTGRMSRVILGDFTALSEPGYRELSRAIGSAGNREPMVNAINSLYKKDAKAAQELIAKFNGDTGKLLEDLGKHGITVEAPALKVVHATPSTPAELKVRDFTIKQSSEFPVATQAGAESTTASFNKISNALAGNAEREKIMAALADYMEKNPSAAKEFLKNFKGTPNEIIAELNNNRAFNVAAEAAKPVAPARMAEGLNPEQARALDTHLRQTARDAGFKQTVYDAAITDKKLLEDLNRLAKDNNRAFRDITQSFNEHGNIEQMKTSAANAVKKLDTPRVATIEAPKTAQPSEPSLGAEAGQSAEVAKPGHTVYPKVNEPATVTSNPAEPRPPRVSSGPSGKDKMIAQVESAAGLGGAKPAPPSIFSSITKAQKESLQASIGKLEQARQAKILDGLARVNAESRGSARKLIKTLAKGGEENIASVEASLREFARKQTSPAIRAGGNSENILSAINPELSKAATETLGKLEPIRAERLAEGLKNVRSFSDPQEIELLQRLAKGGESNVAFVEKYLIDHELMSGTLPSHMRMSGTATAPFERSHQPTSAIGKGLQEGDVKLPSTGLPKDSVNFPKKSEIAYGETRVNGVTRPAYNPTAPKSFEGSQNVAARFSAESTARLRAIDDVPTAINQITSDLATDARVGAPSGRWNSAQWRKLNGMSTLEEQKIYVELAKRDRSRFLKILNEQPPDTIRSKGFSDSVRKALSETPDYPRNFKSVESSFKDFGDKFAARTKDPKVLAAWEDLSKGSSKNAKQMMSEVGQRDFDRLYKLVDDYAHSTGKQRLGRSGKFNGDLMGELTASRGEVVASGQPFFKRGTSSKIPLNDPKPPAPVVTDPTPLTYGQKVVKVVKKLGNASQIPQTLRSPYGKAAGVAGSQMSGESDTDIGPNLGPETPVGIDFDPGKVIAPPVDPTKAPVTPEDGRGIAPPVDKFGDVRLSDPANAPIEMQQRSQSQGEGSGGGAITAIADGGAPVGGAPAAGDAAGDATGGSGAIGGATAASVVAASLNQMKSQSAPGQNVNPAPVPPPAPPVPASPSLFADRSNDDPPPPSAIPASRNQSARSAGPARSSSSRAPSSPSEPAEDAADESTETTEPAKERAPREIKGRARKSRSASAEAKVFDTAAKRITTSKGLESQIKRLSAVPGGSHKGIAKTYQRLVSQKNGHHLAERLAAKARNGNFREVVQFIESNRHLNVTKMSRKHIHDLVGDTGVKHRSPAKVTAKNSAKKSKPKKGKANRHRARPVHESPGDSSIETTEEEEE